MSVHVYTVEFRIFREKLDPAVMTSELGLQPCQVRRQGDLRSDGKGLPMAQTLGVNQPAISRLERKYVSTLANFVKAMGGKLEIRAVFPDGEVRISQFSELGKRIKAAS
jgi:hypothetical protein